MLMNESGNLMVPTARLELARPRSLPPQDSVSTNSTTSAKEHAPLRFAAGAVRRMLLYFYCGMSPALEPAFGLGAGAGAAGWFAVVGTAVRSRTLVERCC